MTEATMCLSTIRVETTTITDLLKQYEDCLVEIGKLPYIHHITIDWFGLFGFMAYQPLQVIQRQIHFYVNNLFY